MRAERDLRPVRHSRRFGRRQVVAAQGRHHPAAASRGSGVAAAAGVPAWGRSAARICRVAGPNLGRLRQDRGTGSIRDRLFTPGPRRSATRAAFLRRRLCGLENVLEAEGQKLRGAAGCENASILISVDQAEEMARADGDSGEALADYLRVALVASRSSWQLALTIRTDSFPELQSDAASRTCGRAPTTCVRFQSFGSSIVVEEPAKRYGVEVDHGSSTR